MFSIKKPQLLLFAAFCLYANPLHADDFPEAYSQSGTQTLTPLEQPSKTYSPKDNFEDQDDLKEDVFTSREKQFIALLPPKFQPMVTRQIFEKLKSDGVFAYLLKQKETEQSAQKPQTSDQRTQKIEKIYTSLKSQDPNLTASFKDIEAFLERFDALHVSSLPFAEIAYIYRASLGRAPLGGAYIDAYGLPHSGSVVLHGVKISVPPIETMQKTSAFEGNLGRPSEATSASSLDNGQSGSINKMSKDEWFLEVAKASWEQIYQNQYMQPAP